MNILVLNGSPKGEKSNTLKLTEAFLKGMNEGETNQVEMIHVKQCKVEHCKGCYGCWNKTPGKCLMKDDMEDIIQKYIEADLVIWSLPLYYFSMPSKIKAVMDRLLPINLPFIEEKENSEGRKFGHPQRYNLSNQKYMLISTCGFCGLKRNYEGLLEQFKNLYGEKVQSILCAEGELFSIDYLHERTNDYLVLVEKAGCEYSKMGEISVEVRNQLEELLFSQEKFIKFSAEHWGVTEDGECVSEDDDKAYRFMKQMAAVYNPEAYEKDIILEMYFTDKDQTYQFVMQKDGCTVRKEGFAPYTTRIETPLDLWQDIARGKVEGTVAMAEGKYKTLGEFSTMLKMEALFSTQSKTDVKVKNQQVYKPSNMFILLLPFIALWVGMPIDRGIGVVAGVMSIIVAGMLQLRYKPVQYENLGNLMVGSICVFALLGIPEAILVTLPSIAFGVLWLSSLLTKIPLTAHYACKDYGSERAFINPIFMRANRILTCMWGIANVIMGCIGYLIVGTVIQPYWALVSNCMPIILGLFTIWFIKYYPAKVARGCK